MGKKLIVFILLIAIIASISVGCTFFNENEERAANEVLATVESDGITLTVTKNELLAYVNYMAQQYSQYQQTPDYETMIPEVLDYMINQKYLVIKGMVYLKSIEDRQACMVANNKNVDANTPEGVLTLAERYNAIKTANETFQEEIEGYISDYREEQKNLEISKAKDNLASLYDEGYTVSSISIAEGSFKEEYVKDEELDDLKVYLNINLIKDDDTETVVIPVSDSMYDEDNKFSTEISSEDSTKKVVTKEVVITYDEPISTNDEGETEYETHKSEPVSYNVVTPRGTETVEEEENELEGDVPDRYKLDSEIADENKADYFDYNVNTTSEMKDAYRQFREAKKNMLINFEKDGLNYYYKSQYENAIISAVKHEISRSIDSSVVTDEMIEAEYAILVERQKEEYNVLTTDEAKVNKFAKDIVESSSLNLESTYYIPVASIDAEGYELDEFVGIAHILFKFDEEQNAFIDKEGNAMDEDALRNLKWQVSQSITTDRSNPDYDPDYECPLHSNNEGECNYEGDGICPALAFDPDKLGVSLFGENGIYNQISTALENATTNEEKIQIFKEFMVQYNDDGGAMKTDTGYMVAPEGIAHSYDGDDFPGLAWNLLDENATAGSAFLTDEDNNQYLGYCFTSYGLHLMMITFIPFEDANAVAEDGTLNIDTALDMKGNSHRELLREKLIEDIQDKAYDEFTEQNDKDAALENATKNTKKFKKLMKNFGFDYNE